jgi:hypothetical protein
MYLLIFLSLLISCSSNNEKHTNNRSVDNINEVVLDEMLDGRTPQQFREDQKKIRNIDKLERRIKILEDKIEGKEL